MIYLIWCKSIGTATWVFHKCLTSWADAKIEYSRLRDTLAKDEIKVEEISAPGTGTRIFNE